MLPTRASRINCVVQMRRRDTTAVGDIAELAVTLALVRCGRQVLRPLSAGSRYDLAIDNRHGTFTRVQCKSGVLRHGRIEFRMYSVSGHSTRPNFYTGDIDAYDVYCAATGEAYLVPLAALTSTGVQAALRISPTRNGQSKGIRLASDFRIA